MAKQFAQCTLCNERIKLHDDREVGYCIHCKQEVNVKECIDFYLFNHQQEIEEKSEVESTTTSYSSQNTTISHSDTPSTFGETIVGIISLCLLLAAAYFKLNYTTDLADTSVVLWGKNLILSSYNLVGNLGIKEGIINALLILGKSINQIFVDLVVDFIKGFNYSLFGNSLWLLFGWVWTTMKAVVLFFPRYFVMLYQGLVQGTSIAYFGSFVITTLLSWFLLSKLND